MAASRIADEPHLKHYYIFIAATFLGVICNVAPDIFHQESVAMVTEAQLVEIIAAYEYSKYCPVSAF